MFSAEISRKAEEDGLVMERWKAESGYSQKIASSSAINPTPAISPRTLASSVSGLQNYLTPLCDHTGQIAPPGMKPNVTTTLWEDEGCLCFLVETKGIRVARREDNHMINGTKLLNVAGMTRGRRDSILKSEKSRHVVKTALMHLKGIWIPFERALEIANQEKITESLYPLFLHDIGSFVYQPLTRRAISHPESKPQPLQVTEWTKGNDDHDLQIGVLGNSDESLRRFPLYDMRNHGLHEQGPIGSLYKSLIETLRLILIEVRMQSDMSQYRVTLEKSCAALFFWGTDLGLWRGELDDMLQDSPQLRDTCLTVLVSICQFVSTSLVQMISSEQRQEKVLQSTGISTSLEQAVNMIEEQHQSTYRPEQDVETLCQTLRTKIDTLIMLAPSLASPAEESFDDEEPRAIQDVKEHLPEQAYANSISQKFPLAASAIVARLGKLNWDRYNHMLRLQRETTQQELQTTALEKARTIFNDSGLGVSLPTQSEVGFKIAVNPSRPESIYVPSVVSSRAEVSHKRVPPLPAHARAGEPFTCEICNKKVKFRRTKAWKKHVFDDILAYACFFVECHETQAFFENSEALMNHLQNDHGMDVRVADVICPLCVEFISGDRDALSLHIARHMEEIALAVLPSGVESDEESVEGSISEFSSSKDDGSSQEWQVAKLRGMLARLEKALGPGHYETLECMNKLAEMLSERGQYKEAEAMNRQVLERYEKVLGPDHPKTLASRNSLSFSLKKTARHKEAEPTGLANSNSTLSSASSVAQIQDYQEAESEVRAEEESEKGGDEPTYCYCNDVSYGEMVACDNDHCLHEWFHLACVGLEKPPPDRTRWFCSDECKDAHALALANRGRRSPSLGSSGMSSLGSSEVSSPILSVDEQVVGMPGSLMDRPKAQPGARPGPSSYWSVSELQDFDKNVAHFGTDWIAIANHMGTKTHTMIKNQYLRLIQDGKLDLKQMAKEADARRDRGEDMGPPPTPTPAPQGRYRSTRAPTRPITPTPEIASSPPHHSEPDLFRTIIKIKGDERMLPRGRLTRGTEVFYSHHNKRIDPEMKSIEGEGVLFRITSVIGEGKQRRYELIDAKPDLLTSVPFRASEDHLFAIPANNDLSDLDKGKEVFALYPNSPRFYKAEVVASWRLRGKEGKGRFVQVRFVDEDKNEYGDVERRYVIPVSYSK